MRPTPTPTFLALVRDQEDALLRASRLLTGDWERAEELLRDVLAWALSTWEWLEDTGAAPLRIRQRLLTTFLEREAEPPDELDDDEDDELAADRAGAALGSGSRAETEVDEAADDTPTVVIPPPRGVTDTLAVLTAEERAILVGRYYLSMSSAEIAEVVGMDADEVATTAEQTLAALRWHR